MHLISRVIQRNWGLQPNITSQDGKPQSIRRTLSTDQSKAIIANLKSALGAEYTITHLAQAAVFATVLKLHPPGPNVPDSQAHLSAPPVNGRRFLTEEFATGGKSFDSMCIMTIPVVFKNIKSYDVGNADRTPKSSSD
ncbi:trichothecene 15-O-acetyltransferase [Aspergillus affinis]|uniref:trichothecene 15-O-acetyltransferase n=1 Tax=Aspergillus affinis TaxID=1070780 RepID=UPI0022FE9841|nr:trichothecene 15-O-acetyltransferase [Aspergillus affinis]KAI9036279.1 trichothecene 15-O-acetyltransferase [Aspergillus affinis]